MSITKKYITADELVLDSFKLGVDIYNSGFRPNFIVGVWRGGTPVGIAIQEILAYLGNESDHIAIRTSSYIGLNNQSKEVRVHGIDYLISNMNAEDSLLLVDDVFDSGRSIKATDDWLVFPHEMDGLTEEEIFTNKKNMKEILSQVITK